MTRHPISHHTGMRPLGLILVVWGSIALAGCGGSGDAGPAAPQSPYVYHDTLRRIELPFPRTQHAAVLLPDGRVLIVGGLDESGLVTRQMVVFDPQTEQFAKSSVLGTAGPLGAAVATLPNGDALLVGGFPSSAPTNAVRIDARTLTLAPTSGQPHSRRVGATATHLGGGRVLVAGGLLALTEGGNAIGVSTTPDSTVELFDTATGTFTQLPAGLNVPRSRHAAIAMPNGGALIIGGITESGLPAPAEVYDPLTKRFTLVPTPDVGVRASPIAVTAMDDSLWVAGGDDGKPAPAALSGVLRFDAVTKAVSRPLTLAQARTRFAGALLTDGRWLLAGGAQGQAATLDSTELIDLRSATQAAGPRLGAARHSHTATVLPSGKVLILGGTGPNGQAASSAEIFE